MAMRQGSNSRRRAQGLPLDPARVDGDGLRVARHRTVSYPVSSQRLEVVTDSADHPPSVRTALTRVRDGRQWRWNLTVEVDSGNLRPAPPAPVKTVLIDREELLRLPFEEHDPSVPEGVEISTMPTLLRRRGYRIRFGELRYDPTTVFNPDGRKPYYDTNYPWRCLVWIETPRGWSGSGVLIGPRHVLTASHCMDWTPGWFRAHVLRDTIWIAGDRRRHVRVCRVEGSKQQVDLRRSERRGLRRRRTGSANRRGVRISRVQDVRQRLGRRDRQLVQRRVPAGQIAVRERAVFPDGLLPQRARRRSGVGAD